MRRKGFDGGEPRRAKPIYTASHRNLHRCKNRSHHQEKGVLNASRPRLTDPTAARHKPIAIGRVLISLLFVAVAIAGLPSKSSASELRRSAIVKAVAHAQPSIVNIRGQKTVNSSLSVGSIDPPRRVNGMGTGVIMDSRGYIITNHHVVDGVSRINVTLADESQFVARVISHDPETDLALIKIDASGKKLPTLRIGTSSDLMLGETVIAVGNAYGYPHTVTRGIISALHRTVQVSDAQFYRDLIQTDASINPGNSGGPLMNIDGDLIGINVAVRVGAQGIGFALPVDKVMEVASDLISTKRVDGIWHGVVTRHSASHDSVVVDAVEPSSPAAKAGLRSGDIVKRVADMPVRHGIDLERALLGSKTGREVNLQITRRDQPQRLTLVLTSLPSKRITPEDRTWSLFGLRLESIPKGQFRSGSSRYRGGLAVTEVRRNSPASGQGIRSGDVLVGMHIWETVSRDNIDYVLDHYKFSDSEPLKFYILRGKQTLFGYLRIPSQLRHQLSKK
jgi:serine protease Do